MSELLEFTTEGLLPPNEFVVTFAELEQSVLVDGPDDGDAYPGWDAAWRRKLVQNLGILVGQLQQVGITEIFVNGSFVEDKEHPNDIDGYFECELMQLASGELQRELNLIDPYKIWTWDPSTRRPYRGYPKLQLPMWHQYRLELYPHVGQLSGIQDQHGNDLTFPSAFRLSREGKPKGIVKIGATS